MRFLEDSAKVEATTQTKGGENMKVRMVCFKAPKFLSGLLRLLAGKRKGA